MKKNAYFLNNKKILHTSPHPDDAYLGYFPYVRWLLENTNNKHCFLTMTSGSNAVRNSYLLNILEIIEKDKKNLDNNLIATKIYKTLLKTCYDSNVNLSINEKIRRIKKDLTLSCTSLFLKSLKGYIREFEEESVWKSFGISEEQLIHFRAKFYFQDSLAYKVDINKFYKLLLRIKPDVLTLAIDPKDFAPNTHYKTFLVIQSALEKYYLANKRDIEIIGYRNVWHQFLPEEANIFFPVIKNDFETFEENFLKFYKTQINAMFPNKEFKNKNFAQIAKMLMIENYKKIKTGYKFYQFGRDVQGICLLKKLKLNELINLSL